MKRLMLSLLASSVLATPAFASRPPACFNGGPASSYNSGVQTGRNAVRFLWDEFGNEFDMEGFFESIAENIDFEPTTSEFVACGNDGYADGVWQELNEIRMETSQNCLSAGAAVGRMNGKLLCATTYPQMTVQSGLCVSSQRSACTAALRDYVNDHCVSELSQAQINAYINATCKQISG